MELNVGRLMAHVRNMITCPREGCANKAEVGRIQNRNGLKHSKTKTKVSALEGVIPGDRLKADAHDWTQSWCYNAATGTERDIRMLPDRGMVRLKRC